MTGYEVRIVIEGARPEDEVLVRAKVDCAEPRHAEAAAQDLLRKTRAEHVLLAARLQADVRAIGWGWRRVPS